MQTQSRIRYRVAPLNPAAHVWEVELTLDTPSPDGQRFMLPAWIPGSYMIRDFSRTLITMSARDQDGPVGIRKLDKDTWLADPVTGPLTLTYTVYGWELTVRCTHLDQTHGYFNGTSLFLSVHGQEDQPCDVHLVAPSDPACKGWRIATSMPTLATDASGSGPTE